MKKQKQIHLFTYLSIIIICAISFVEITYSKSSTTEANSQIALAKTNKISILKNELNFLIQNKIPLINQYNNTTVSFDDEINTLNKYIEENDIDNAKTTFNNLQVSIQNNINTIKDSFKQKLNTITSSSNGLSDDYTNNLVNTINSLVDDEDFENIDDKLNILQYKINNLLYDSGQATVVDPLIIDGILIVNKNFGLPNNYGNGITQEAMNAFNKMSEDAKAANINLYIASGFRNYNYQQQLLANYVDDYGNDANRFSSTAGHSEHQTGLSMDIGGSDTSIWVNDAFCNTTEYKWLKENSYKYGFIIRYPENKENITGYIFEPWHYRYVGTELSTYLTENSLTLEEYFEIN